MGNMLEITRQASHIAELDERYCAFADRLRMLASQYQSKAILHLVEQYMSHN